MNQRLSLNAHLFNFKLYERYSQLSFKLRFSPIYKDFDDKIKPKKTEPLKNYTPTEPIWTREFSPLQEDNFVLNQNILFLYSVKTDVLGELESQAPRFIVELFIRGLEGTKLLKKYPANKEGMSNLGHNVVSVGKIGKEVHEQVELVFDEIIFCTASLVVHCQTVEWVPRGIGHRIKGRGIRYFANWTY